jgi:phage/conjugal plasmid C-4 type zinc finger TraR family protein
MAGGWTRDGAVEEQIEASLGDELARLRAARRMPVGESLTECAECGETIPEARRAALPGVKLCVDCQGARDARPVARGGINRRGSKDSQLK